MRIAPWTSFRNHVKVAAKEEAPVDIAIAGAGIAGLTLAILLRRQGARVVIFDKLNAPAPVGSGLIIQPTGQAVMAELGLLDALEITASRLDALHGLSMPSGRVALDVTYSALG